MVCIKTCAAEPQSQAQDGGEVVVKLGTVVRKDWVNWCPGKEGKQTHWSEFLETCRWRMLCGALLEGVVSSLRGVEGQFDG